MGKKSKKNNKSKRKNHRGRTPQQPIQARRDDDEEENWWDSEQFDPNSDGIKVMQCQHWNSWFHTEIPFIGNVTPVEAARSREGRERLDELFDHFDAMRGGGSNFLDINIPVRFAKWKLGYGPGSESEFAKELEILNFLSAARENELRMGEQKGEEERPDKLKPPSSAATEDEFRQTIETVFGQHRFQGGSPIEDPNDPRKYVVDRFDFCRIPRWPNDGIEEERQKFRSGENEHIPFDTNDPEHKALENLLGGFLCETPLDKMDIVGRSFVVGLPFQFQMKAAKDQEDPSAAKHHLIEAYKRKDADVFRLLQAINCQKAIYKASCDPNRFPDFRAIFVPLFQKQLASDANIALLFGRVSYVRPWLLEIGASTAAPPPSDSPAGALLSQFETNGDRVAPGTKICAECQVTEEVAKSFSKCSACKTVHYCSAECQKKHWPIHRPDCLRAQGKEVPNSVLRKAMRALEEREEREIRSKEKEEEEHMKLLEQAKDAFAGEPPDYGDCWAHDCNGKMLYMHIPSGYSENLLQLVGYCVSLETIEIVSLGMFPDGIDHDKYGFRGVSFRDANGARVLALYERLYSRFGNGPQVGVHICGVFVVDRVSRNNRAQWRLVREPTADPRYNRFEKACSWLDTARCQAKAVPETVDLGIHNQGDPVMTQKQTPFGTHTEISGFTHEFKPNYGR